MAVKVSIGPPILTINQGSTVMVTDLGGEIALEGEQGVFAADTRFVSVYKICSNGRPWTRLASSATTYLSAKIYLVNQSFTAQGGEEVSGQALNVCPEGGYYNRVEHCGSRIANRIYSSRLSSRIPLSRRFVRFSAELRERTARLPH